MPPLGKGEEETCVLKLPPLSPRSSVAVLCAVLRIAINEGRRLNFRLQIPIWTLYYSNLDALLFRFRRYVIPIWTLLYSEMAATEAI